MLYMFLRLATVWIALIATSAVAQQNPTILGPGKPLPCFPGDTNCQTGPSVAPDCSGKLAPFFYKECAQQSSQSDFVIQSYKFNPVQHPAGLVDVFKDCMNNKTCAALAETAAAYVGVPPGTLSTMARGANAYAKLTQQGEEHFLYLPLGADAAFCRIAVQVTSAAPAHGKYSPTFSIGATSLKASAYAFVHKLKMPEGKSWWEGIITVTYVRRDKYAAYRQRGNCTLNPQASKSYTCKGAKHGTNGGHPACAAPVQL